MASDYIPRKDAEALSYFQTMLDVLAADPAHFGLQASEITTLQAQASEFGQRLQTIDQLAASHAAEVQRKNQLRSELDTQVRSLAQRIQANPTVERHRKVQAGLPVYDRVRSKTAPVPPTDLIVTPHLEGFNELRWKRGSNPPGTIFIIEAKTRDDADFVPIDAVSAPRYKHMGCQVGVRIAYRVRARRAEQVSDHSTAVGVYLDDKQVENGG